MFQPLARIILTALLACALTAASGGIAWAGSYEVRACTAPGENSSWEGAVNNSFGYIVGCPGSLFLVGHRANVGNAPDRSAASLSFHAPGGTWITGMRTEYLLTQSNSWVSGIADPDRWLLGGPGCVGVCSTPTWGFIELGNLRVPSLHVQTYCQAASCSTANGTSGTYLRKVHVTLHDPSNPSVRNPRGELWTDQWQAGRRGVVFDAADNSGIQEVRVLIDGHTRERKERTCVPAERTCPEWSGASLSVLTSDGVADGRHTVTLQALDRGGNVGEVSRPILVDNTSPAAPEDLSVVGGQGWRRQNNFAVVWGNPSQAGRSPIAGIVYRLCPVNATRGKCEDRAVHGGDMTKLEGLNVPGPGEWTLRAWLRDAAGNARDETAAPPVRLRLDEDAPEVAVPPLSPEDPTRVLIRAADKTSSVVRGEVELRREGTNTWQTTRGEPTSDGFDAQLDDERLPDGRYDLRARVVDAAGNERSTDRFTTGDPARVTLPVRIAPRLVAGRAGRRTCRGQGKKRHCRRQLVVRPRARFGRTVKLHGRLTLSRRAMPSTDVEVWEQVMLPDAGWNRIGTVRTSRTGRFEYRAPGGPARIMRFRFPGTKTIRPRNADVDLRVRASTTLRVVPRRVVNGEYVTFRGRVRGSPLPSGGKLVELQAYAGGRWRTFALARARPSTGRWVHRYRFAATRGRVRYRFRARVRREDNYPFHTGTSRRVRVTVVGL